MKKTSTFFLLLFTVSLSFAQNIFSGERVQVVGTFNGFVTTPYGTDYRTTTYRRITTTTGTPTDGRGQWKTTINVQPSGGDATPINMPGGGPGGFLFISGPLGNPFQNKWTFSGVGQAGLDAINTLPAFNSGNDMGLNMSTVGSYTFVMSDPGYNSTNASFYVAYTNRPPITVTRTSEVLNLGGSITVNIGLNQLISPQENVYVRSVVGIANDFSGATATSIVQATGSLLSYVATIPPPPSNSVVKYYVFSSTRTLAQLISASEFDRSLSAISVDDNAGANYSTNVTLPLQLNFFKGEVKNGNAILSWQTSFEKQFKQFEVEKNVNGAWGTVGVVNGNQNGAGSNYSFDAGSINAKTAYRLKMVDKDGRFAYSPIVVIDANSKNELTLLGNPVKDAIRIGINNVLSTNYEAQLLSIDGKLMQSINYKHAGGYSTLQMPLQTGVSGTYLLKVISSENTIKTFVVVF
jgi:hypothetical protein